MKKSQKPTVSVIMSVKDGMPYLTESVKSILVQSYINFEFIIVDDASTDNTLEFLKSIKDKRVILIKNNKNLGLAISLNKALKIAKGDFIARMDADDISLPERIKIQIDFMECHPTVDICGTWVTLVNKDNKRIGKIHYPVNDKEIKTTLRRITPLVHPTWFLKTEVFQNLNGYDPDWDFVEDYDFLIRASKFKMANVSKELLLWRSQDKRRSNADIQKMYTENFQLRWKHFGKRNLDISYLPYLIRSFISTYFFPPKLKIFLNQKSGLT